MVLKAFLAIKNNKQTNYSEYPLGLSIMPPHVPVLPESDINVWSYS